MKPLINVDEGRERALPKWMNGESKIMNKNMSKKLNLNQLLHGGDYNPDQWLDYPEILEEDLRFMKKANINCVTLGVFSWPSLEPEDGIYDFDWLNKIMDRLYENGIYTILATPTGALPHWMTEKYDEVKKVSANGIRRNHGNRHNFCPSSPVMRRKMREIDSALSKRFGTHPGLIAWHISNEYAGDTQGVDCHCSYCEAGFKTWLKNRYQTLDALNHAWWTKFWGNTYTDWSQIYGPSENSEQSMHGIKLDWKRYISDQMLDFCEEEIASIRKYSDIPTVANFMGAFKPLDYFKWAEKLDMVSLDNYPLWHSMEDDLDMAVLASMRQTLTRSLKKQPYLLMESTPSSVNWAPRNSLKRPGMHELSSLQAIAHGADSVQYFQWRKSRGGCEKYHGAVIDHKNGDQTRVFRDVEKLGVRLNQISSKVLGTCNKPKVAIVFDWENWWAVDDCQAVMVPFDYHSKWKDYYQVFWEKGIDVDIVNMDDTLEGYALVVAPINYMYRNQYIENVKKFVKNGGVYITTYWSGEVDESDLCFLESHPLREVLGIQTEEIDVKPEHYKNQIIYKDREYEIKDLCALIHAEKAEVLATYQNDFYAGYPALTRNSYGEGYAYFIASENQIEFIRDFYQELLEVTHIQCSLNAELPEGVSVAERTGKDEKESLWFVMNFQVNEVEVLFKEEYKDIETGDKVSGKTKMNGYQCMILQKL